MWLGPAGAKLVGGPGACSPGKIFAFESSEMHFLHSGTLFSYFHLTTFGTFCNLFSSFEHRKMVKNMCSSMNKKNFSYLY